MHPNTIPKVWVSLFATAETACTSTVKNRVNEIADIMHDLGFKMGGWYRSWSDLDRYTHMWLSSNNGEIHMNVCDHATISIEDLLEKFRIEEEEPVDVDLSALLFG